MLDCYPIADNTFQIELDDNEVTVIQALARESQLRPARVIFLALDAYMKFFVQFHKESQPKLEHPYF